MMPGLLAGVGLTHLTVYDGRPGPDGVVGGCAHVHAVTDEAYFCIGGQGAIDLHDLTRGYRQVALSPGAYVQFTPGTLHRSVNHGGLQLVCLMGNSGLAERGDARIYFGPEADRDPELYRTLQRLPEKGLDGALERRDRAAEGHAALMRLWADDRDAYRRRLAEFINLHAAAMSKIRTDLESIVQTGPAAWLDRAQERLERLPALAALAEASRGEAQRGEPRLGMCGLLRPVHIEDAV